MQTVSMQDEIQELNLSYLLLAQRMLNEDRTSAMFRLKVDGKTADVLGALSVRQLARLARCNQVVFGLHFDNADQLTRATSNSHEPALSQTHAAMLLASV
ncbi:MAG: flagellar transcriptional regulator FlhD [Pseudomonas sp.]